MPPEFSVRASSVDVEQIMKQIRARIREKRGVDYTEGEIRELASIKLEKFLDPTRVRSELLEHYRRGRPSPSASPIVVPPAPANYTFEAETAYLSSRGALGRTLYAIRRLLGPVLKLFVNLNPMIHVLNMQSTINRENTERFDRFLEQWQERENRRTELDALGYEVAHNLVVEMTRLGIEVKNLKMRVESLSSRLDFNERRARALESVVQYRPGHGPGADAAGRPATGGDERRRDEGRREDRGREERGRDERGRDERGREERPQGGDSAPNIAKGDAQRNRRKRRRRGRGQGPAPQAHDAGTPQPEPQPDGGAAESREAGASETQAPGSQAQPVDEPRGGAPETPDPDSP